MNQIAQLFDAQSLTLAMDTSTAHGGAALLQGTVCLAEFVVARPRGHADALTVDVQRLLDAYDLKVSDLALIAVGAGPGAFTGVRSALATARALAWTANLPVVCTSSLEVLAWGAAGESDWVAAVLDARKQQIYGALYRCKGVGALPEVAIAPGVFAPDVFVEHVRAVAGQAVWVGEGLAAYPEALAQCQRAANPLAHRLSPAAVGVLGRWKADIGLAASWAEARPLYLRVSEAEENLGPPDAEAVTVNLQAPGEAAGVEGL